MGQIAGATLAIVMLSMLVSQLFYKDKEPFPRALATVLTAWVLAFILATFGNDGGLLVNMIIYGIGAPIALWERHRHYRKHWVEEKRSEWYETFR